MIERNRETDIRIIKTWAKTYEWKKIWRRKDCVCCFGEVLFRSEPEAARRRARPGAPSVVALTCPLESESSWHLLRPEARPLPTGRRSLLAWLRRGHVGAGAVSGLCRRLRGQRPLRLRLPRPVSFRRTWACSSRRRSRTWSLACETSCGTTAGGSWK